MDEVKGSLLEIFHNDIDHLLAALNSDKIDSPLWSSTDGIRFGRALAVMVGDLKKLIAQLASGAHDTRAIVRETERLRPQLERPRYQRIFYPDIRRHRLTTMIVPVFSSVETHLEENALTALGDLIQNRKLDLLRVCPRCELWYLGTRNDQQFCSNNCRQRSFQTQRKQAEISKHKKKKQVKHYVTSQAR